MRYHLLLSLLLSCAVGPAARAADQAPAAPDEAAVAAVIADLEAADFKTRAAAADRLKRLGPEVVPALQKYLGHDDPEVAARVREVIGSFVWMRDGAVILTVAEGGLGQKLGIRVGDVAVKIDDFDVKVHTDYGKAVEGKAEYTLYLWQAGRVRELKVPNQKLGINMSNWDIDQGGNDHARGLAALGATPPDYAEAYRRLRAARDRGMSDSHSLGILAALAARNLDRAYAANAYTAHRGDSATCELTHYGVSGHWTADEVFYNLPFNSPHTEWLLGRYKAEPFSDDLYHELEDWFSRTGQNGPLAAELVARPWPGRAADAPELHRYYHDLARMRVWLDQRRYDDVLGVWDNRARPMFDAFNAPYLAFQAAVRGGRPAAAVRLARDLLDPKNRAPGRDPAPVWSAFALAAALGDDGLADEFLNALDRSGPGALAEALTFRSADGLDQPAAAARVRAWLARRPPAAQPGRLERVAVARLVADPAATADEFAAATKGWQYPALDRGLQATYLTGLLRFGRYDDVTAATAPPPRPAAGQGGMVAALLAAQAQIVPRSAAAFAKANAAALAGPWKEAQGMIHYVPDRKTGGTWLLRYDGEVFRVAPGTPARRFDGLPIPPAPVTVGFRHLYVTPTTVAVVYPYGRGAVDEPNDFDPSMVYVLDENRGRWVPAAEWDGPLDMGTSLFTWTALAERAAAAGRPALPGGTPREYQRYDTGYYWFEGDVLVHVNSTTRRVTDVSAEVGRLAGRPGPARVYSPDGPVPPQAIFFTDCGVWAFDAKAAALRRVPLGLADENVITLPLPVSLYGERADGTLLVGVAPQQGGQVFVLNPGTLAVTPTDGFCGLGPLDWYDFRKLRWGFYDPQVAVHTQYLSRLAAKGK